MAYQERAWVDGNEALDSELKDWAAWLIAEFSAIGWCVNPRAADNPTRVQLRNDLYTDRVCAEIEKMQLYGTATSLGLHQIIIHLPQLWQRILVSLYMTQSNNMQIARDVGIDHRRLTPTIRDIMAEIKHQRRRLRKAH